jgi:hypothetical protein
VEPGVFCDNVTRLIYAFTALVMGVAALAMPRAGVDGNDMEMVFSVPNQIVQRTKRVDIVAERLAILARPAERSNRYTMCLLSTRCT